MKNPFKLVQIRKTWAVVKFMHISQMQREGIHPGQGTFHNRASIKDKVLGFLGTNYYFILLIIPCSGAGIGTDTYISKEK